jgi:hypothetical protein
MLKILCCLALGHRFRVVQEFGPTNRRVKCERCGGDWSIEDQLQVVIDWDTDFEQFWRDRGFEILEPLPAWRSVPVEPLTRPERLRACRWPGAFAMALGFIAGLTIEAAGFGPAVRLGATFAISYAAMCSLMPQVYRRAYERKCNSLRA